MRFQRAMMLLASAGGSTVPVIARLVQADEDTVRDVIHRPRLLNRDDEDFVIQTATTRPTVLGKPFTRWSIRKLADHLRRNIARAVRIGREALRCLLARRGIIFQRTKTWGCQPAPQGHRPHLGPRPTSSHQFTAANSHHPNHTVQTRALHAYLRWRNQNASHPDVLAPQRRERARIRSERGLRWGGRPLPTAA